jgi:hypothetical protein
LGKFKYNRISGLAGSLKLPGLELVGHVHPGFGRRAVVDLDQLFRVGSCHDAPFSPEIL